MARQDVAEVTASKNRWIMETFLFPEIGELLLADISARLLLDELRKIEAAGKLETAKRAKVNARHVFRFALLEGLVDTDPTRETAGCP